MRSRSHEEIRTLQSKPAQCFRKYGGLGFRGLGFVGLEFGLLFFFETAVWEKVCVFFPEAKTYLSCIWFIVVQASRYCTRVVGRLRDKSFLDRQVLHRH